MASQVPVSLQALQHNRVAPRDPVSKQAQTHIANFEPSTVLLVYEGEETNEGAAKYRPRPTSKSSKRAGSSHKHKQSAPISPLQQKTDDLIGENTAETDVLYDAAETMEDPLPHTVPVDANTSFSGMLEEDDDPHAAFMDRLEAVKGEHLVGLEELEDDFQREGDEADEENFLNRLEMLKERHEQKLAHLEAEYYRHRHDHHDENDTHYARAEQIMTRLRTIRGQFEASGAPKPGGNDVDDSRVVWDSTLSAHQRPMSAPVRRRSQSPQPSRKKHSASKPQHSQSPAVRRSESPQTAELRSSERWTRRVTIPKPFSFNERDAVRRKSISQQRLERDLAAKRAAEEAELQVRFRATPLPASTVLSLTELEKEKEKRREEVRRSSQELLKSSERPFSFYGRDLGKVKKSIEADPNQTAFRARPVPKSTYNGETERIALRDEERKVRINERAQAMLKTARLPPRMEMWERQQRKKKYGEDGTKQKQRPASAGNRARPVPKFHDLQSKFEDALMNAKRLHKVTEVEPFHLHPTRDSTRKIKRDISNDHEHLKELRWPYMSSRAPLVPTQPPLFEAQEVSVPKSNRAHELRASITRERMLRKQLKETQTRIADEERKRRAREKGRVIQPLLKDNTEELERRNRENKKTFLRSMRQLERNYEQFLTSMQARVNSSGYLFQQSSKDAAVQKVNELFEKTLAEAGCEEVLDYIDERESRERAGYSNDDA